MSKDSLLSKSAQVAAIIVVPLTVIGLVFAYQGNNKPSSISQPIDTVKIKPNETSNKPQPNSGESAPTEKDKSKTANPNKKPGEVITKPLIIEKEIEKAPSKKPTSSPKGNPSTKSIEETKSNVSAKPAVPVKVVKEPKVPQYFNPNQRYDIAILSKNKKSNIDNLLKNHFKAKGFKSSSSVFNNAFKSSSYYRNLEDNASGLKAIGLDKAANCICLIDENIRYEKKERFGTSYLKATGNYSISIIEIISGEIDNYNIETTGSGTSESQAAKSVHEHLLENEDFKNINIDQCKK